MRCQFCGWEVPDSKGNCEKCGKPMVADDTTEPANAVKEAGKERPTTRQSTCGMADLKSTIRESSRGNAAATILEDQAECPNCGYKLEDGICPSCGYDSKENIVGQKEKAENMNIDGKKTVRPHRKGEKEGRFILTPISEDTGRFEGDSIPYEGNEVELNRENTSPKNDTITSRLQAVITHENGKWYIVDRSELKTTFVQAAEKIEIQNGELILLGNQLYQFDNLPE